MFKDPWLAALIGWLVSMTSRQIGHFFFEPRDYDEVNQATDEYKEAIKVGYNIRRKIVLMTIWALSPLLLLLDPTMLRVRVRAKDLDAVRQPSRLPMVRRRRQRPAVPHRSTVPDTGLRDRPGLDDKNPHRSVS